MCLCLLFCVLVNKYVSFGICYARAQVGTPEASDELLFEEPNELFWVSLDKTLDGLYVLIESASGESSEVRSVDLAMAHAPAVVLAPRRPKVR